MRRLRLRALESDDRFFTFGLDVWYPDGWHPMDATLSIPTAGLRNPEVGSTVVVYPEDWNEGDIW